MKGVEDYKFGQKNHWRRTVWNEIARRVPDKKNAKILYLAGPQDLDREVAKSKGFDPSNMIIVEADKDRALSLRREGKTVIQQNILDTLYNWPIGHRVDVIIADFCCGFEAEMIDLYDLLGHRDLRGAVVLINFQRGRDKSSEPARRYVDGFLGKHIKNEYRKHRGFQYVAFHALETTQVALYGPAIVGVKGNKNIVSLSKDYDDKVMPELAFSLIDLMETRFFSYKGRKVHMDSAIFNHALSSFEKIVGDKFRDSVDDIPTQGPIPRNEKMKRQIIAALAVSTRRKRAA